MILLAAWVLTLLGMPGNWLIVVAVIVYVLLVPQESTLGIGWGIVAVLAVLAALGELLEFLAGALGVTKAGGTRRGAVLALVGSIAGGLVGIFIGLPVPLLGPIVAALLFAALGAMAGAMLGEVWVGKDAGASWRIGAAAFWGRLAGTLGKMLVGAVMVVVVMASLVR